MLKYEMMEDIEKLLCGYNILRIFFIQLNYNLEN